MRGRIMVGGLLAGVLLLGLGRTTYAAKCTDEAAVAAAREAAEAACTALGHGCANAPNHGTYVSCIASQAKQNATLPKSCSGKVKKCAAKSACGQDKISAGFVTCCVTSAKGTKCKLKKSATACMAKHGVVNASPSCCSTTHPLTEDACMASPSGAFLD